VRTGRQGYARSSLAVMDAPLCPDCGQPATLELAGAEEAWHCRNEACAEFGQPIRRDEPPVTEPDPTGGRGPLDAA
jgi:hypothetical protein